MAKNSITDYSKTASLNTDIQSVDIDEGCLPSGINNAIRELMADLAAVNDGTVALTSPAFTSVDINSGTIDGVTIGGASAAAGTFTTFTSTGIDDNASSTAVTIDSSGNVGIGENSPSNPLEVVGNVRIKSAAGDTQGLNISSDGNGDAFIDAGYSVSDLKFGINGTERMRIDSSGNVGIGVAPSSKLDINIGTNARGLFSNNVGEVGTGNFALQVIDSTGASLKPLGFRAEDIRFATGSSERMRIDSSGNVLVGKTSTSSATTTVGFHVQPSGVAVLTRDGAAPLRVSRKTSDGEVISIHKDGTTVGVIGTKNWGIGTSSPSSELTVSSGASSAAVHGYTQLEIESSSHSALQFSGSTGAEQWIWFADDASSTPVGGITYYHGGPYMGFRVEGSERMRIDSSGRLLVNGSSNLYGQSVMQVTSGSNTWTTMRNTDTGSAQQYTMVFARSSSNVGAISTTNTSTIFTTSSDYRLKENVTGITDGIERVKQLAPSRFNFIADGNNTVDGFLAHEVQGVVPEAISGEKDAMRDEEYEVTPAVLDDDGNVVTEAVMGTRSVPDYQGIDQSKLVPLLTAALQEAIAKIEDLEARVATLETN